MGRRILFLIIAVFNSIWLTTTTPSTTTTTTEKYEILTAEYSKEQNDFLPKPKVPEVETKTPHKTITELVNEQTEVIKKLVSQQQPLTALNYPIITKPEQIKEQLEQDSIEELKKKCQHLSKVFDPPGIPGEQEVAESQNEKITVPAFGSYQKPEFLKFRPKFPTPPPFQTQPQAKLPQMAGNYFIFTQNPNIYGKRTNKYTDKLEAAGSSNEEVFTSPEEEQYELEQDPEEGAEIEAENEEYSTSTSTTPSTPELTTPEIVTSTTLKPTLTGSKYVRLEPIILKQNLLPTGKLVFQWFRLLPVTQSFVQIPDTPENKNITVIAQPQSYNHDILLPEQYHYYIDPITGTIKPAKRIVKPTKPQVQQFLHTRPQFFINPQTGMIYQSGLPHQFIYHKRGNVPVSTTTSTTTTTTTEKIPVPEYTVEITEEKPAEKPVDNNYRHEFRFVIPMMIPGPQEESISEFPNKLDPYAYLPRNQRPEMMNIPVPYSPTYHMIHTLSVPNKLKREVIKKDATRI